MAITKTPFSWKEMYGDPRQDPESFKRRNSGFWHHQFDQFAQQEVWTCDKRKLNEKVAEAMLDPAFARDFYEKGSRILDRMFGEGTAYAFHTKTKKDMLAMRLNPFMEQEKMGAKQRRDDAMAYYWQGGSTATTTTSDTTSGTCNATNMYIRDELEQQVRNMPFVCGKGDLLNTLQRDFDHWAKPQMRMLHG